jgi:hypothetical protein
MAILASLARFWASLSPRVRGRSLGLRAVEMMPSTFSFEAMSDISSFCRKKVRRSASPLEAFVLSYKMQSLGDRKVMRRSSVNSIKHHPHLINYGN